MKKILLFTAIFTIVLTNAQSVLVKDIETGSLSSMPTYTENRVDNNGQLLFTVYNSGTDDYHLWSTDGTTSETKLLKTLVDYSNTPAQYFINSTSLNYVYFVGQDDCSNTPKNSLLRTDGTIQNTIQISSFNFDNNKDLIDFNGGIMFTSEITWPNNLGQELIFHNNSDLITIDLNIGSDSSNPTELKAIGNKVYFAATANTNEGNELCISNGTNTVSGTYRLKDINTNGSDSSNPKNFTSFSPVCVFT